MSIEVIKPGPLSSLQDTGRVGWQRFGVITSGVMDEWAHRQASAAVGQSEAIASLEITLMGPSLRFESPALIALAGADLSARIGDTALPLGEPLWVAAGSRLDFGRRVFGCRAYLAVRGGFAVPAVMGSTSTYLRAGFGGHLGRALRQGDRLPTRVPAPDDPWWQAASRWPWLGEGVRALPRGRVAPPAHPGREARPVRLVRGQQWARFTAEAHARLTGEAFTVNLNSDRMGYRLDGPALTLHEPLEMISESVAFGTIQVPPDGQPIVLMADRQTTGGYPKIACVASVDLPLLAQRVPADAVRFEMIDLDAAQALDLARARADDAWAASLESSKE